MRILCGKFQRPNLKFAIIHYVITPRSYFCNRLRRIHHSRRRRGCEVSHYENASFEHAILISGDLALELGISSQPWLSKAYLSPLMAQGTSRRHYPRSPNRRCSATGFCAMGRMPWHKYNIYSKTYTEGSDPNAANLSIISPLQAHIHRAVSSATDKVLACV